MLLVALLVVSLLSLVAGEYYSAFNRNNSSFSNAYVDSYLASAHQYAAPAAEQFNPSAGYYYPKPQKQQSLFTHDSKLHIYLTQQSKQSLYCATDSTYEKIVWRKYECPDQVTSGAGELVAIGPMVSNYSVYGINIFGRNQEYVSELLLKQPLTAATDGVYVCEGTFIPTQYPHDGRTTVRDLIIIGGRNMYANCFSRSSTKFSSIRSNVLN